MGVIGITAMPSINTDLSVVTAEAVDVLSPRIIVDKHGVPITGTMVDNGTFQATTNYGGSVRIPEGYHNGEGTIKGGTLPTLSDPASPAYVYSGRKFYANGANAQTGTMPVLSNGYALDGTTPSGTRNTDVVDSQGNQVYYVYDIKLNKSGYVNTSTKIRLFVDQLREGGVIPRFLQNVSGKRTAKLNTNDLRSGPSDGSFIIDGKTYQSYKINGSSSNRPAVMHLDSWKHGGETWNQYLAVFWQKA